MGNGRKMKPDVNQGWMRRSIFVAGWLMLLSVLMPYCYGVNVKVRILYFSNRGCPDCQAIKTEVFPEILAQHQNQLELRTLELSSINNFKRLLNLEKKLQRKIDKTPPLIIVGHEVLEGETAIRTQLEPIIAKYLKVGGTQWPD